MQNFTLIGATKNRHRKNQQT